jgi:SAM-dependent methyltransferase
MPIKIYSLLKLLHMDYVFNRRVERLAAVISDLIPEDTSVLDIGCGNGHISSQLLKNKPGIRIKGLELKVRDECLIPCQEFDGEHVPFEDDSYDFCLFVDVLHHANDSNKLLMEAARVCRKGVIIKDHLCENIFDLYILKFRDEFLVSLGVL